MDQERLGRLAVLFDVRPQNHYRMSELTRAILELDRLGFPDLLEELHREGVTMLYMQALDMVVNLRPGTWTDREVENPARWPSNYARGTQVVARLEKAKRIEAGTWKDPRTLDERWHDQWDKEGGDGLGGLMIPVSVLAVLWAAIQWPWWILPLIREIIN